MVAALVAAAGRLLVFPFGCWNNDEAVYQLQAASLAAGRLFPAAPGRGTGAVTPWLTAARGDVFVPKYSPVASSFYAIGEVLRAPIVSFAIVAALAVIATAGLTRALGGRQAGVGAALAVFVMPVFAMQSWTALSYLPTLTLSLFALWAAVSAVSTGSVPRAAGAGALAGVVAFARPLDGAIVAALVVCWLVIEARGRTRMVLTGAAAIAMAAVGVVMLAYNVRATGDIFTLPFNVLDRSDSWGLGEHRLLPGASSFDFSLARMLEGAGRNLMLVLVWAPGSLLGVALAVRAIRRGRLNGRWLLIAWATATFVAYAFFWGSYNATITWGATNYLGPYYFLPVMTVVAIAAGTEMSVAGWPGRRLAIGAVGAISVLVMAFALPTNLDTTRVLRAVDQSTAPARAERSLVVIDPSIGDFLNTPYGNLGNDPRLSDTTLYAIGNPDGMAAVDTLGAGRQLWTLTFLGQPKATATDLEPRLDAAKVIRGQSLHVALPASDAGATTVQWGSCVLTRSAASVTVSFEIAPEGLVLDGADQPDRCPPVATAIILKWGPVDDDPTSKRFVPVTISGVNVALLVAEDAVTD
jgi:hypothetical protein